MYILQWSSVIVGAMNSRVFSKLKIVAAVLVGVNLAAGEGLFAYRARATDQPAAKEKRDAASDFSALDRRIQEIQPTAKEKRFDEIGWAKGIREAERLAKESNRPVFLFSNVGQLDL